MLGNVKRNEFYFVIDGKRKGPFLGCQLVEPHITKDYNYAAYLQSLFDGKDPVGDKLNKRKEHMKIVKHFIKGKKASKNPTCKYLVGAVKNEDLGLLQNDHTLILNIQAIAMVMPEKVKTSEVIIEARKNPDNLPEVRSMISTCHEEQNYLFVLTLYHAALKKLDIIIPGMYYLEPFYMLTTIFNNIKAYKNLEIYLIDLDTELLRKEMTAKEPEKIHKIYAMSSYRSIFEILAADKAMILARKPKFYMSTYDEYFKHQKAEPFNIEIFQAEEKKTGGGRRKNKKKIKSITIVP